MITRIVTWNLNHHRQSAIQRKATWNFLVGLKADFALLQECVPSEWPANRVVFKDGGIGGRRSWGSAVVSFNHDLEELSTIRLKSTGRLASLCNTWPGSVAIAYAPSLALSLVSLYGLIDNGYAITTVHRQLSDLTPLFDSTCYRSRIVVGGDFNISTQFRSPDGERHRNAFERLQTLGMVDAIALNRPPREPLADCPCSDKPCSHIHTQRHNVSKVPWQNDYMYVGKKLAPNVVACYPIDGGSPGSWQYSDHCPIMLEVEF
ncbi:hypothetical protein SAMN06265795_11253 [Noviherbaspirillum humi]|uniref:Endonuclease/exonuclease/phosphatase domain-containing protein n=1 Tax=Noviherbaspirillum humi TaxID=1688639 RepID=A0A239JB61_9BURK|nr:hypothetical protein SAMN06265795_11253 [Noviherbaspirillum humi]